MTSEDTHGVTIIADPVARQHALTRFFLWWLAGAAAVLVVAVSAWVTTYLWVAAGVILVAAPMGYFRSSRIGLRTDAGGVTIRNFSAPTGSAGARWTGSQTARSCRSGGGMISMRDIGPCGWCCAMNARQPLTGRAGHRGAMADGGQ